VPDVACPGVLGEDGHEDHGGLVVGAPGGESLAVEGAFELGVEAFGVLAHAVQAVVSGAVGSDDAQVFGAVELRGGVGGDAEQWFPPIVRGARDAAGEGESGVELVTRGAVLVVGGVAFGLVAGDFSVVAVAVGADDLFVEGAGAGSELVSSAVALALFSAGRPGEWFGCEALSADGDPAAACGEVSCGHCCIKRSDDDRAGRLRSGLSKTLVGGIDWT